jgi:hypothetical protein
MENTEETKTQNTRTNRQRRKALRINDRILVWAVNTFQRKTGADTRVSTYGTDPLAK